jgi:hypothetical protein
MGARTNAILAFGFDLGEDLPEKLSEALHDDGIDGDTEEFEVKESGVEVKHWQSYTDYKDYAKAKKHALSKFPIEFVKHCSGEYTMYFLAIRGTEQTALRGYPEKINLDKDVTEEKIAFMKEFCLKYDIEWQEPAWHIFSMWN